jgi:hypothetical protein
MCICTYTYNVMYTYILIHNTISIIVHTNIVYNHVHHLNRYNKKKLGCTKYMVECIPINILLSTYFYAANTY